MDVARKVVILARECGLNVELSDVSVDSLVPEPLQAAQSAEEFMAGLPQVKGSPSWRTAKPCYFLPGR